MKCSQTFCSKCKRKISGCSCLEARDNIEYDVCVKCKDDQALKTIKLTQELNAKLKKLGVLYEPKK